MILFSTILEAVLEMLHKKPSLKISQNSQVNIYTSVLMKYCGTFENRFFYRTALVAASVI